MNNWKIINKIAIVFGIIFAVFTTLAAVFNYEFSKVYYEAGAPASLFTYGYLTAMLPFLAAAVLSFLVAFLISRTIKSQDESQKRICPTCGGKLRFISEYQRWYCDKEKKYI